MLNVANENSIGKRKVESVSAKVEMQSVYPLLRGRDIAKWCADPSLSIIHAQDVQNPSKALSETVLQKKYPFTHSYFLKHKEVLLERKDFQKFFKPYGAPFYSLYNFGAYTFAPYKVVWREIATSVDAVVISRLKGKAILPDHKLLLVAFDDSNEAHYFCALINSSPFRAFSKAASISTHNAPATLTEVRIPKFDVENSCHSELAEISARCHKQTAAGIDVSDLEEQIDELAAELWGLTKEELKEIKNSLEEMR